MGNRWWRICGPPSRTLMNLPKLDHLLTIWWALSVCKPLGSHLGFDGCCGFSHNCFISKLCKNVFLCMDLVGLNLVNVWNCRSESHTVNDTVLGDVSFVFSLRKGRTDHECCIYKCSKIESMWTYIMFTWWHRHCSALTSPISLRKGC